MLEPKIEKRQQEQPVVQAEEKTPVPECAVEPGILREDGVYRVTRIEKAPDTAYEQQDLFDHRLLNPKTKSDIIIIGQLFETYWLVQFEDKFYMIDQHAAHEKVLYERTVKTHAEQGNHVSMVARP